MRYNAEVFSMQERLSHYLSAIKDNSLTFVKWQVFAVVTGGLTALAGTAFY